MKHDWAVANQGWVLPGANAPNHPDKDTYLKDLDATEFKSSFTPAEVMVVSGEVCYRRSSLFFSSKTTQMKDI
jgi:hypothetical protein